MPELSNIQTYVKLEGTNYRATLDVFASVLKEIGIWDNRISNAFNSFEWTVEDNGFIYGSLSSFGYYTSKYSRIKVRPHLMVFSSAVDNTFQHHWVECSLLIMTKDIFDFDRIQYFSSSCRLVENLVSDFIGKFAHTGVYFTNEAQDGEDFDGVRTNDQTKLWAFDYAIIPSTLFDLYRNPPKTHKVVKGVKGLECYNTSTWRK